MDATRTLEFWDIQRGPGTEVHCFGKGYSFDDSDRIDSWRTVGILSCIFDMKGSSFERMVMKFNDNTSNIFYHTFVEKEKTTLSMAQIVENEKKISTFKYARYATDVIFQQHLRPRGRLEEGKNYFSGKHKSMVTVV